MALLSTQESLPGWRVGHASRRAPTPRADGVVHHGKFVGPLSKAEYWRRRSLAATEGEGASKNNFCASKVLIGPHLLEREQSTATPQPTSRCNIFAGDSHNLNLSQVKHLIPKS
jgi:hypothetical protein